MDPHGFLSQYSLTGSMRILIYFAPDLDPDPLILSCRLKICFFFLGTRRLGIKNDNEEDITARFCSLILFVEFVLIDDQNLN